MKGFDDPLKEVTSDTKAYLKRCLSYAIEQNKGDIENLKKALINIPYHVFDVRENCGDWCKSKSEKENEPRNFPHGFESPNLFEALKEIFLMHSENCERFAAGASSQSNESLNYLITRKSPKTNCYCLSESADTRVKCAVSQKNCGYSYLESILKFLNIEPGFYLCKNNYKLLQKGFEK